MKKIVSLIITIIIGISLATNKPIGDAAKIVFRTFNKSYKTVIHNYKDSLKEDGVEIDGQSNNHRIEGKVVKVYDADTITLLDDYGNKHKIRFYGIDAPELKQTYGKTAQMHLSKLIKNELVEVEVINKDRYGRTVGKVFTEDGILVNKWLVEQGHAFVYEEYNPEKDEYLELQNDAKKNKRGLWKLGTVEKPSEYRKHKK